ncbi:hypothetical protein EV144_105416 [Flavobacterium sp. 270]|uniref:hypothetical protein n=1 Tax=Flavobacterium sp. 270 TaxID=2512114 RepID=UPI001064BF11|nr:hypothetical protein [Flavobacterium sp. 270]TDW47392.1 hypothetical protein EV144_105416 [Flavobacterium sp. 270]
MNNIVERFKQLAENEGITITGLEHRIGASKGVLSRALVNNSDIQSKWLLKLVENYPRYSCDWLVKGKGPMIVEDNLNQDFSENEINYKDLAEARKETIDTLKKMIVYLEEKITANKKGQEQ